MWTANIVSKTFDKGQEMVHVDFTNDSDSFSADYQVLSADQIGQVINDELSKLNRIDLEAIPLGPTTALPSKITVATPEQVWLAKYTTYLRYLTAINHGFLTMDDPDFIALEADVRKTFSKDYMGNIEAPQLP